MDNLIVYYNFYNLVERNIYKIIWIHLSNESFVDTLIRYW